MSDNNNKVNNEIEEQIVDKLSDKQPLSGNAYVLGDLKLPHTHIDSLEQDIKKKYSSILTEQEANKKTLHKAVHSSKNIRDQNRSNDSETFFLKYDANVIENIYKENEDYYYTLCEKKILSKRNVKNLILLSQYYLNHMHAVTSDGVAWRVYDSHIISSFKSIGFGWCTLNSTLRILRAMGHITVQIVLGFRLSSPYGRPTSIVRGTQSQRIFSLLPIFSDFNENPHQRILFKCSYGISGGVLKEKLKCL